MKLTSALLTISLSAGTAMGQTFNIDLNTSQRGWIDDTGLSEASNGNYIAGAISGTEYRNYFTFDLSGLIGVVESATLTLDLPASGFASPTGSEVFALSGVDNAITGSISDGLSVFADLGDGSIYGVSIIDGTESSVSISLNSEFLSAINSGGGSSLSIGGALLSLSGSSTADEYAFAFSDSNQGSSAVSLALVVNASGSAVPEPSSAMLLGLTAAFGLVRRRR